MKEIFSSQAGLSTNVFNFSVWKAQIPSNVFQNIFHFDLKTKKYKKTCRTETDLFLKELKFKENVLTYS